MSKTTGNDNIDHAKKIAHLRVSASTHVGRLAGSIKKYMFEGFKVELLAIGAGAVNQGVKAIAVARSMSASEAGPSFVVIPGFRNKNIDGLTRSAVVMRVVIAQEVPSA